jgi:cyclophilin family peptidyl-prolyl cis-trans isomerase
LEGRQLLTSATLQPISPITVPAKQGYTVPLLAATGATAAQTYTVTSSNPNIAASIATGPFWNVGVSYTDPANAANDFSGTLTFQLFQSLTPTTVSNISMLTNDGYFVNSGKFFSRIISGFVVQGGSPTLNGLEPNPPVSFGTEVVQQLAFTGTYQLGMAHSSLPNSNTSQFFITLGPQNSDLSYRYTVFGQLLTGVGTVNQMAAVPVMANTAPVPPGQHPEISQPVNPITITSATLTSTSADGVLLLDTTQANAGQTSTITITATDPSDGTKTSQAFVVTVGSYGGPTDPSINFRPLANSSVPAVQENTATKIQLRGQSGYPDPSRPGTLTYTIVSPPTHGTITNFNPTLGTFTYTPDTGFKGVDTLKYQVTATGPVTAAPAPAPSNVGTVSLVVGAGVTGAVIPVDNIFIVQPVPKAHVNNTVSIAQVPDATSPSNSTLLTTVNGLVSVVQPPTSDFNSIIVYGGKHANNDVVIDPSVTLPSTISSGQGQLNKLVAGSAVTREHGWFGHTTLVGGTGPNQLIGLAGHVKFKPTKTTTLIYTAQPRRRTNQLNPVPPVQTYYRYIHGHLIAVPDSVFKPPPFKFHKLES